MTGPQVERCGEESVVRHLRVEPVQDVAGADFAMLGAERRRRFDPHPRSRVEAHRVW